MTSSGLKPLESEVILSLKNLRYKFMPLAGFGGKVSIFIQEPSWPDYKQPPQRVLSQNKYYAFAKNIVKAILNEGLFNRTLNEQAKALKIIVHAAISSGTGVYLIDWFDFQDAYNILGDQWGLVTSNFKPKPSYLTLKSLIGQNFNA